HPEPKAGTQPLSHPGVPPLSPNAHPAHPLPVNLAYPPGLSPTPLAAPQGNLAFSPDALPHLVPQPGYPGCQTLSLHPPPAPGTPPVNPWAQGMVARGMVMDKKMWKKMKKVHKKMHKHHEHDKHSSSCSSIHTLLTSSDTETECICIAGANRYDRYIS
uniref:Uncharacterized protein n=1 Tax=Canis lupus familiaris TaxID=9615 RepID=A0A8C0RDK9_CANLF